MAIIEQAAKISAKTGAKHERQASRKSKKQQASENNRKRRLRGSAMKALRRHENEIEEEMAYVESENIVILMKKIWRRKSASVIA
jgi:hypothetical protein